MDRTLAILKPDCIQRNLMGQVLSRIENGQFKVIALKMIRLSETLAKSFYAEHADKPFYEKLVLYMTEGPIIVAVLEKENAIEDWRDLMGDTDPEAAREGTIRNDFGDNVTRNVVHGSDSNNHADKEIAFFFSKAELECNA